METVNTVEHVNVNNMKQIIMNHFIPSLKYYVITTALLLTMLFWANSTSGQSTWTLIEDISGVSTDIYYNSLGEQYITKKDGVLLFEGDTFATYGVRTDNELGLLSVAEYNEQVCVCFSGLDSMQHLVCDNDTIVSIPYDFTNHVGGDLVVHDTILYISTGYGTNSNDAQDTSNFRGKILAWNGDSLWIHSIGFRNPWRFDVVMDTFYVADVGWNTWEELDVFSADSSFNGGWGCWEGKLLHIDTCGQVDFPVHGYLHANTGNRSITGIGHFEGFYFYTDFYTGLGFRWSQDSVEFMETPIDLVSGAVDPLSEQLYAISLDGKIYRYDPIIVGIIEADPKPKEGKRDYYDMWIAELIESYGGDIHVDIYGRVYTCLPRFPGMYFSPITNKIKIVTE